MTARGLLRALLPPVVTDALDAWRHGPRLVARQRRRYGRLIPGSIPYAMHKREVLERALADETLLAAIRRGGPLPAGYGIGLDERCVEYPWLLAHLPAGPARVLDAGSTLNFAFLLDVPALAEKTLHILTLAPEPDCFWQRGVSYLFSDLRDLPGRDGWYDAVVCLSTLEHVGCDNAGYTGRAASTEADADSFVQALGELRRVLRPGGTLFLTVPFGRYEHFGRFQQFDRALLTRAEVAFGPAARIDETFFRYRPEGWTVATAEACGDARYVESAARPVAEGWPPPAEPDLAAAARSVACVRLVKA